MAVDVVAEIDIARPRVEVAAYAADPDNATAWYRNIKSVEWKSPRPLAVATLTAFVAEFSGAGTHMTFRNRGESSGFAKISAPVMARAMRRANGNDLRRLKAILEGS